MKKQVNFNNYSESLRYAFDDASKKYDVVWPDDCPPRPQDGETTKLRMEINNSKKCLHIQVYGRGTAYNNYELNYYIL